MGTVRVELFVLILKCSCFVCLRASSPGRSGGGARKGSYFLELRLWNLNICIELFRCEMLICGDDITNEVITFGTCLSMFVTFARVSA